MEDKRKNVFDDTLYDKKSVKRIVSIIAFIVLVIGFFVDLFSSYSVSDKYINVFLTIVGAGLFGMVVERFVKKDGKNNKLENIKNDKNS